MANAGGPSLGGGTCSDVRPRRREIFTDSDWKIAAIKPWRGPVANLEAVGAVNEEECEATAKPEDVDVANEEECVATG